jgi:hypothetical protein
MTAFGLVGPIRACSPFFELIMNPLGKLTQPLVTFTGVLSGGRQARQGQGWLPAVLWFGIPSWLRSLCTQMLSEAWLLSRPVDTVLGKIIMYCAFYFDSHYFVSSSSSLSLLKQKWSV